MSTIDLPWTRPRPAPVPCACGHSSCWFTIRKSVLRRSAGPAALRSRAEDSTRGLRDVQLGARLAGRRFFDDVRRAGVEADLVEMRAGFALEDRAHAIRGKPLPARTVG